MKERPSRTLRASKLVNPWRTTSHGS